MSYANGTTHYNLPQTVGTDKRDWFDTNKAFEDVDADLYSAKQTADNAASDISALTTRVGTAEGDISSLSTRVGSAEGDISALQSSVTGLGNDLADVKADLRDAICSVVEPDATADYAHAVDSYFWYNDTLYITTVAIAVGDTIVPNTNCNTTNITTEIAEVKSDLSNISPAVIASVPKDGVRTYTQALNTLYGLLTALSLDNTQISDLKLKFGNANLHVDSITDNAIYFSGLTCGGGVVFSGVKLAANGSEFVTNTLSSAGAYSHVDNSNVTAEGLYLIR